MMLEKMHRHQIALLRLGGCVCCRHSCARALLAIFGTGLLCALCYIVVLYILLFGGWFNPWCSGFTFNKDPCNGHGVCFSVSECKCDYTYGPDHRYSLGPKGMELNVGEPSNSEPAHFSSCSRIVKWVSMV